MKKHKLTALALIIAATLIPNGLVQAADKDPMSAEIAKMSGAEFEAAYLTMMIHHHQDGVKMAEMVPSKAKSDKLKQMAKKIAADQQKEIGQMTGWLKQWHTKSPGDHKMPAESMKMMKDHMSELNAAQGEEFDKKWAKLMAHHHEGAISMAQLAVDKAQHQEVKDMAKTIISSQKKERQELLKMSGESSSGGTAQYTCSMHPEVVQKTEGKCPKCGMKLEKKAS
jgi:uncharacterized protein (DUF305 family)